MGKPSGASSNWSSHKQSVSEEEQKVGRDISVNNSDEKDEEKKVSESEPVKAGVPLAIPEPKVNSSNDDFLAVIESLGSDVKCDNSDGPNDLFVIDKSGDAVKPEENDIPEVPGKS